eukprot:TRINITY_DN16795_c0_g1_i2.p1 TRINITY_DN16795_c0_g1~~TRINITY_DN16795_c0_g1_i2.p1  ORF type:complete len:121 (+),score=14.56 TRINITY_DN16795_c0_g1_i2:147-509(+)
MTSPVLAEAPPLAPVSSKETDAVLSEVLHRSILEVNFPSEQWAMIVMNSLSVDSELHPDKLRREISVQGPKLRVHFETAELRLLRAAFNAFMDMLILATRTLEEFDAPQSTNKPSSLPVS